MLHPTPSNIFISRILRRSCILSLFFCMSEAVRNMEFVLVGENSRMVKVILDENEDVKEIIPLNKVLILKE